MSKGEVRETKKTTYILEDLDADSTYEAYVEAENKYGVSEKSVRIVFRTAKSVIGEDKKSADSESADQDELGGQERYGYTLCINGSYLVTASHGQAIQYSYSTFGSDTNVGGRDYYWTDLWYRPFANLKANIYQLWHFKVAGNQLQFREQTQTH